MSTTPSVRDSATPRAHPRPTVLVLGTAEWNSPIATNQHYVVRELAQASKVYFVESLGLRRVRLDARDLSRMAGRLRRSVGGSSEAGSAAVTRPVPDGVQVISPVIVPLHRPATRLPNRVLLDRAVAEWRRSPGPHVLWAFAPVTYGLEKHADATVYHCVDIFSAFPGIDSVAVSAGERSLASGAQQAIATSTAVAEHLRATGFTNVMTLPNVADVEVFERASSPADQRQPSVLFAGNLSPYKLDFELLRQLATALRGRGELLLAGPIAAGGGGFAEQLAELEQLGARYLGMLSLEELARAAGTCAVGIIPYARNEYTRGVSPLKFYEYLASGLHVVGTAIPEVIRAADGNAFIEVGATTESFVAQVLAALDRRPSDATIMARRDFARSYGWRPRGELLRGLLGEIAGGPRPDGWKGLSQRNGASGG